MFRPDRSPDRPVNRLGWRLRIFAVGAVLAGAGLYLDAGWAIWAAIGVLLVGMLLRFLPEGDDNEDDPSVGGDRREE